MRCGLAKCCWNKSWICRRAKRCTRPRLSRRPPAGPETAGKPPAPEAKPPESPVVSSGLAFVIETPANGRRQVTWIEIQPCHPERYVQDPEVRFDADRHRLRVQVEAVDPNLLPPSGSQVVWEPIPKFCEDSYTKGKLDAARNSLDFYAAIAADPNRVETVELTIDGYPRAFIFHNVGCFGGAAGSAGKR